ARQGVCDVSRSREGTDGEDVSAGARPQDDCGNVGGGGARFGYLLGIFLLPPSTPEAVMATAGVSAGLLMFRRSTSGGLEVYLAHPGGPFFKNKDDGSWTIPKGEIPEGEEPLAAALREFEEETGLPLDESSKFHDLGS